MRFVVVPIGTAYFGRDVKAAVVARPSTIDPPHTVPGCDLISCSELRHRWLLKCLKGQLRASFLGYGVMPNDMVRPCGTGPFHQHVMTMFFGRGAFGVDAAFIAV